MSEEKLSLDWMDFRDRIYEITIELEKIDYLVICFMGSNDKDDKKLEILSDYINNAKKLLGNIKIDLAYGNIAIDWWVFFHNFEKEKG